jgi:hypothetical protein
MYAQFKEPRRLLARHIFPLALLAFVIAISPAAAAGERAQFKVTSTLDGKRVLPVRMRWIADTQLPAAKVSQVEFLIDGKVRWIEHQAPYSYAGGDAGRNLGYLITTWLTAGQHRFTVRVTDTGGRKASDTVTARVLPAPEPPAPLKGMWTRAVTDADLKKSDPTFGGGPPAGVWKLVFDRVGAWHLDPMQSGVVNQYSVRLGVIHVYAPIAMAPEGIGVSKFGYHGIGPQDCTAAGPFGTYRWSVTGNKLTLTAIHEGCGQRRAIWEGIWKHVR